MHSDLFESAQGLGWLPDEIVFSLASRYHRVSGNVRASTTCQQLFGHARQGSAHDFPSRIREFARITNGYLGDAESIIREHTILPFFLPYRSKDNATAAYEALRGTGLGSLKFTLGLLTSRFRANHPLKACRLCMAVDRKEWSIAYWHRIHQLPGVWICPIHLIALLEATVKSTGVERFLWHLPDESLLKNFHVGELNVSATGSIAERLRRLADAAVAVTALPIDFHFDPDRLLVTYQRGIKAMNLATANGSLRREEIGSSYLAEVRLLRVIPEFNSLPDNLVDAQNQVTRLLYKPRGGTHPIRHLLIIIWLFGTFDRFWCKYQEADSQIATVDHRTQGQDLIDKRINNLIHMLREGSHTVSSAAKLVGVSTVTAMAWAARAGIETACRPKHVKGDVRSILLQDLRAGMDKQQAAEKHGVSVVSITRILRTELGLHLAWKEARHAKARASARAQWSKVIENNPGATIKFLRLLAAGPYAWLYRNDRVWLDAQRAQMSIHKVTRRKIVDWDERDLELAAAVRRACLEIEQSNPNRRIALWQIYQKIPELKAKLSRLSCLPLTKRAIEVATRPSRQKSNDALF